MKMLRTDTLWACLLPFSSEFSLPAFYLKLKVKMYNTRILPVLLYGCEAKVSHRKCWGEYLNQQNA